MNNVPPEKAKSAPITDMIADGNPYTQYESDGLARAKNMFANAVDSVPNTEKRSYVTKNGKKERRFGDIPMK
jgi:hypothetical protein